MPDAKAGSWAAINGTEFINSQRTIDYVKNLGIPLDISEDCWCPQIQSLLSCTAVTAEYVYPGSDPAPWYDSSIPESSAFLGFLPIEFDGLGSTYTRPSFESLNGGSLLGRLRPKARTLTWKGFLIGTNCCSVEYGMRWLTSVLAAAGGCDGCSGTDLDILLCCPDIIECADCDPSAGIGPTSDAFRSFHNVGLADGPHKLNERELGCCKDCSGCIMEVEFSLICGNPFMHKDPVTACGSVAFPACGTCPGDADTTFWKKVFPATYPATTADAGLCDSLLDCQVAPTDCVTDPNCTVPTLPTIPKFEDPCGCDAYNISEICCEISSSIYGFFEGVPGISIFSGSNPLHNVAIKFYENPQKRSCTDKSLFDVCNLCDSVIVRYIPANSTLTLDGLTRQINIECPGGNEQSAESLVSSIFKWPTFTCIDYVIKISADCNYPIASNASATVIITPREM